MTNVILTGFVGTGKTTVGRLLADRYGVPFVDTDAEIERQAGCTIAELWAAHEEPYFRDLEHRVWQELLAVPGGRIIATGAGLLMAERNRALLGPEQRIFCLAAGVEDLASRLQSERGTRPLLAALSDTQLLLDLRRRWQARRPIYELYEQVETSGRSPEQVAGTVASLANLELVEVLLFTAAQQSRVSFGRGMLASLGEQAALAGAGAEVVLVTDTNVEAAGWRQQAEDSLFNAGFHVHTLVLPAGENHKTLHSLERIYAICAEAHLDRNSTIVGLGGGVIGDLAGMAAATYLRGLHLVLVPTTLLAQVDAAIGGKVGVDFAGVKNLVGSLYAAGVVLLDPDVLSTLPLAVLTDGLAEIIKIAIIRSAPLLARLETLSTPDDILRAPDILRWAAQEKLAVVRDDPQERGDRALLNFGHTVGHGLEAASGYTLSHGQAISAGMMAELDLAVRIGSCDPGLLPRLAALLTRCSLPLHAPGLDAEAVFMAMCQDKKRSRGQLRFALPTQVGTGVLCEIEHREARMAIASALGGIA